MKRGMAMRLGCIFLLAVGGAAAGALGEERPGATALRDLRDHRKVVRLRAVQTIAETGFRDEDLRALVARLQDDEQEVRAACVAALINLGPRALPPLLEALGGSDPGLRGSAAEVLGQLCPAAAGALPLLVAAANEGDERVRRPARASIGKIGIVALPEALEAFQHSALMGDEEVMELWSALEEEASAMGCTALTPLAEALEAHDGTSDQDRAIRALALRLLGFVGPCAIPALAKALGDPLEEVREAAAVSLAKPGVSGMAALGQALRHPSREARLAAAGGLGSAGEAAVPVLTDALGDTEVAQEVELRKTVVEALGRVASGHGEAVASLERMATDPDQGVAIAAVRALGHLGAVAVPALLGMLDHPTEAVRNQVFEALGRIGSPAVPALVELLEGHDKNRLAALSVLIKLGDDAAPAIPALLEALRDEDAMVRQAAVYALAHGGPPPGEVVPYLLGLLHDDSERVRRIAQQLLSRVDPEAARAGQVDEAGKDDGADGAPTRVERVDIVEYGLYGADVYLETKPGSLVSVLETEHLLTTQDIPARLGTTFGLRFVVRGTRGAGSVPVRVKVLHPPFRQADSDPVLADQWDVKPSIGETLYTGWTLDEASNAPGDWTIQLLIDGRVLAEKAFHVRSR